MDDAIARTKYSFCTKIHEVKTKAPNSDYHNHRDAPPVAARQAEVARDYYFKSAARIGELNDHPPGSDGPMATALKRYNGGRVLVFVVGAFAEMSEDESRICSIIAHDLARTHVSYYNDDAKRTKGMYRQRIQKAWGHTAHGAPRLGPPPSQPRPGPHHPRPGAPRRQRRGDADGRGRSGRPLLFQPPRERGLPLPRRQPLLLLF